ncbi:MAG: 5'-nucleotidase C-terminal domain-containing protein, partial [Oscillospiraceae bacterium]|nr:5'-nucleotidase C-terminal domain-containing protein [Oscillospiraceae bacterium]
LNHVNGIDFVIDGHSHTVMTEGENGEPIQSTGTKFAYVGVVVIDNATKKIEDHFLMATEETDADGNVTALLPKDEATAAKAAELNNEVDSVYGAPFAKSEVELNGEKAPNGNRDSQTNNGNLITDSMLWYVINTGSITKVDASNIVAITNGGGIRAPIKPGDVSRRDINSVLPFGNTVAVIYVTGEQLLETLEASTYELPIGGYPQTAGIKWTLDTSKTFERGDLYTVDGKETSYYAPKSIQRVSIQSINGKDFDPAAMYAVVTNNFIAVGGDTYAAFHEAYLRTDEYAGFDTSIPLDEAVVEYVTTELKGVISAEKYSTDRGDLTMLPLVETVPASTTGLSVNGTEAEAEHYTVGGEDYYKLRDIAALLTGTNAQFDVSYDAASDTVLVTTGTAYAAVGGELVKGADRSAALIPSPHSISVDGSAVSIGAYIVDGTNFFRLADLADIIGFTVETDANGAVAIAA